jgi:hypothetical protein
MGWTVAAVDLSCVDGGHSATGRGLRKGFGFMLLAA